MKKHQRSDLKIPLLPQSMKEEKTAGRKGSSSCSMLKNAEKVKRHIVWRQWYAGSSWSKDQVAFCAAKKATAETDSGLWPPGTMTVKTGSSYSPRKPAWCRFCSGGRRSEQMTLVNGQVRGEKMELVNFADPIYNVSTFTLITHNIFSHFF